MSIKIKDPTTGEWIKQSTGGGGSSAPSDWAVNDPSAAGYVKNRTHYIDTVIEHIQTVTFDGNMADKVSMLIEDQSYAVKVTDAAVSSAEELVGAVVTFNEPQNGNSEETVTADLIFDMSSYGFPAYRFSTANSTAGFALYEDVVNGDVVYPRGIYLHCIPDVFYPTKVTFANPLEMEVKTVHKLPVKYLPEGYPYVEGSGETVILEETAFTDISSGFTQLEQALDIKEGGTYTVTWNGAEYTCDAFAVEDDGVTAICLGNKVMMGEADTGEPFVIASVASDGVTMVILVDSSITSVTVKITENSEVIHKLDNKFIDAEWMATYEPEIEVFYPEREITSDDLQSGTYRINDIDTSETFVLGNEYAVSVNGEVVKTKCTELSVTGATFRYLGNIAVYNPSLGSDTGENFCMYWLTYDGDGTANEDAIQVAFADELAFPLTFSVGKLTDVPIKLPEKFLPEKALKKYYEFPVDLENCFSTGADGSTVWNADFLAVLPEAEQALADGYIVIGTYCGVPCLITKANYDEYDGIHSITFAPFSESMTAAYGLIDASTSTGGLRFAKTGKKELILASSTEGSTKKFKITIDDNGTITPTEIT